MDKRNFRFKIAEPKKLFLKVNLPFFQQSLTSFNRQFILAISSYALKEDCVFPNTYHTLCITKVKLTQPKFKLILFLSKNILRADLTYTRHCPLFCIYRQERCYLCGAPQKNRSINKSHNYIGTTSNASTMRSSSDSNGIV